MPGMTTLAELQDELAKVKAAISAAYTGAEYDMRDGNTTRRLKRQDLTVLLRRRSELELSISRLDPDGESRGPTYAMPVDSPRGNC